MEETLQELFLALSTRWRQKDDNLAIGMSQGKLLQALEIDKHDLEKLLQELKAKITFLGLELVEYLYKNELWYSIRANYCCPSEIKKEEEATLAIIIGSLEKMKNPSSAEVSTQQIKKKIVSGKYLSEYQFDRVIKNLEYLGYIKKGRKGVSYSPRTLIEFSEEARKHIAQESQKLIF